MSGSIFGNVPQIQIPDFGQTLARAQGMQANRLAMVAQQRQMDEADQRQQFFAQHGAGFSSPDQGKQMNLLAMLAQQPGGAAMALPLIQQAQNRQRLQAALSGDTPAAPMPQQGATPSGSYIDRLVGDESGGDPNARNPRSSATGAAQFIDSTWLQFAQANPQLFQGMSRDQVLAARSDPNLSRQAADWYRRENMSVLSGQGLPANDGTAALAHRFGPGDAARLLRADSNAPIATVVSPQVMAANPDLAGRTVGQVVTRYGQRFGGGNTIPTASGDTVPAQASSGPERVAPRGSMNENAAVVRRLMAVGTPEAMQMAQIMSQIGQRAAPTEREALFQRWRDLQSNPNPTPSQTEEAGILRAYLGGERTIERGPNSFDSERGTTLAKEEAALRARGRQSGQTLSRIGQIERDLERVQTGATSGARITMGQIAQTIGIPDNMLPPGFRRDDVAGAEGIRAQAMGLIQGMLGSGEFPTNNFSNADMQALQQANPSLANSPAGNRAIIGVMRAMAQRNLEVARAWDEWRRTNGSGMDSFDRFNLERLPDITSRDVLAPVMNDAFPANPGDPMPQRSGNATPAAGPVMPGVNAEPPPQAQQPVRVRTPEEARRLPPGTPIMLPDGSMGRVPGG
jgi:hypothetical protein